ncbi:hypothetical protein FHT82_003792 [Rhizobium sp. BK275]|uniref:hypothetical protein n=1 Tax=Rhizobium sp. BK316 TaxID=2587053 RepID=UPI00161AFDB8|nr:hypothetical protein [Rhizobium sp. BK316]MBB3391020.1 hypothetical protein [Rhizobium sp. BK275]MBB3406202.1 hypothetical protein [Rhizobium sp. BK316]
MVIAPVAIVDQNMRQTYGACRISVNQNRISSPKQVLIMPPDFKSKPDAERRAVGWEDDRPLAMRSG